MLKVVPKRKWRYPLSLEREYSKYLVSYVEKNMDIMKQFLPDMEELLLVYGLQADAHVHMEVLLDRIHKAMVPPEKMRPVANAMSIRVDRYNQQEWDAIIKSVLGMPMSANGRIHQDSEADDALRELWVAENLDLIKSVDQQTMERIKQSLQEKIVSNVNRRELVKYLTEDIERITGLERNRAILIARDQVGKLNGRLMQYRQTQAGITEYKWSTSGDRRVRASHVALNGKTFTWGPEHPAPEGPPGTPIRCRCVALPVIDLDKVVTRAVPGSYEKVENSVQNTSISSIMNIENSLGEAKKRKEKISITEIAIQKVRKVSVPGFTDVQNAYLQYEHKKLLEYALRHNDSDEVIGIMSLDFGGTLYGKGTEEAVGMTPQMESYKWHLPIGGGIIIHNHPKGKLFSFKDIGFFISESQIGVLTVVSNQGAVQVICKQKDFSRARCIEYIKQLYEKHEDDFDALIEEFLKTCGKVGIIYVRG